MTCSEKRDLTEIFMNIACTDSSVYAEYNGASFKENIEHKWSYDHFYSLGWIESFSENSCLNSVLSRKNNVIAPIAT